jgi:hypothetical protein
LAPSTLQPLWFLSIQQPAAGRKAGCLICTRLNQAGLKNPEKFFVRIFCADESNAVQTPQFRHRFPLCFTPARTSRANESAASIFPLTSRTIRFGASDSCAVCHRKNGGFPDALKIQQT